MFFELCTCQQATWAVTVHMYSASAASIIKGWNMLTVYYSCLFFKTKKLFESHLKVFPVSH